MEDVNIYHLLSSKANQNPNDFAQESNSDCYWGVNPCLVTSLLQLSTGLKASAIMKVCDGCQQAASQAASHHVTILATIQIWHLYWSHKASILLLFWLTGMSRILAAHAGWGVGWFCLLGRQASMMQLFGSTAGRSLEESAKKKRLNVWLVSHRITRVSVLLEYIGTVSRQSIWFYTSD